MITPFPMVAGAVKEDRIRGRSHEGFSLTELLVVLAVIGLLVSLLLPALAYARFRSRVTVCTGQFKQLALASSLYATDNKGGLLPAFTLPTATSKLTNYNSIEPWFVALPMLTHLEHYGVTPQMWFCPTRSRWTAANEFFRWKSGNREISSAADLIAYYGYQGSPMAGLDMFWWVPRSLEGLGTTKFPDPALIKARDSDPWPEKSEAASLQRSPSRRTGSVRPGITRPAFRMRSPALIHSTAQFAAIISPSPMATLRPGHTPKCGGSVSTCGGSSLTFISAVDFFSGRIQHPS